MRNIKLLTACTVMVAVAARAGGYGGHDEELPAGQTQNQGQTSTQLLVNTVKNGSSSQADSRANANARAASNSGGNLLSATGGESSSSSAALGGIGRASVGDTVSVSEGGTGHGGRGGSGGTGGGGGSAIGGDGGTGGESGDSISSSGGNSQSNDIFVGGANFNATAHTSAPVFAGHCQTGGSGQVDGGGFSIVNSDQFCDHVRAAAVMYRAYEKARVCRCEGVCTDTIATVEQVCKESENAEFYLAAYHENLRDAHAVVQKSKHTGLLGRIAGQLTIPLGLIAVLLL